MPDETKSDQIPATEDKVGSLLDISADLISTLNLPAWMIRNASKAFGQFCSAAVDIPVAYFEGKAAEIRAGNAIRIAKKMNVPAEYAQRAVGKFTEKIIREQMNLDKVFVIAANELKKERSDSSTDQNTGNSDEKIIDDNWLNSFEEEARQKSTEDMQLLFGRILAGEIRKPGAYSIQTVKVLGRLSQNTARLFRQLCSICVAIKNPIDGRVWDLRVPYIADTPRWDSIGKYGLGIPLLDMLQEYGLISSNLNTCFPYNMCILNQDPPPYALLLHQGQYWGLDPLPEWDKEQKIEVLGILFSLAGRELFPIVDLNPAEGYTEDLKEFFANKGLQMVEYKL